MNGGLTWLLLFADDVLAELITVTIVRQFRPTTNTVDSPSVDTKAREGQPKTTPEMKRDDTLDLMGRGVLVAALGKRKGHAHEVLASS
jgi:hypothetical protein